MVIAAIAVAAGARALSWQTAVPSVRRVVRAPSQARGVSASEP